MESISPRCGYMKLCRPYYWLTPYLNLCHPTEFSLSMAPFLGFLTRDTFVLFYRKSTEKHFFPNNNLLKSPRIARYARYAQYATLTQENVVTLHVENQRRAPLPSDGSLHL